MTIPPRSRLYNMAPAGLGTGFVESATGYSSRLAAAHNVTLAVLFGHEIAPLLDKNHLRNSEARSNKNAVLSNSFRSLAPAVDGHGTIAKTYIASLQKLTMRGDLPFMTMLPWKEVISHRHLIRPIRVWCPACYDEWHSSGVTEYDPLLWSLAVITVCTRHRRRLRSRCHRCRRELRPLASRSRPGYCSMCHAWLGEPAQNTLPPAEFLADDEFKWRRWIYEQTCNLLTAAPALTAPPGRQVLAKSISLCIRASIYKTEQGFARNCGLSQSSVNNLCRGACVPQLSTLLKIASLSKVSVLDLILGRTLESSGELIPARPCNKQPRRAKTPTATRRWTRGKVNKVWQLFEGLLKKDPPLPMTEIRKRLNYPASILLSRFPDLCRKAVSHYREHVESLRREFWECVRKTLEKQLTEKAPLSVAEVARDAGRCRTAVIKQFPELCAKLFSHWNKRRAARWDEVEAYLQDSLNTTTPLRLRDIAKQLKVSHTALYQYFPRLCHKIAERYALHMRQARTLKKESLRNEVREMAMALYKRGAYPSVRTVARHLGNPVSLRNSKVALDALRELRREFGVSFKGGKLVKEARR
jgi:transcriptional regulator with XRE-family HTH domain